MGASSVLKRCLSLLVSLAVASLLIFLATNSLPGDLATVVLGTNASPAEIDAFRSARGLDRPLIVRYGEWLGGVLTGDFGTSMITGRPVWDQISSRLGITCWLVGLAMVLAVALAVPWGAFAAVKRRRTAGFLVSAASHLLLAIPAFWLGIWLVVWFAVRLRWLPPGDYVAFTRDPISWARHMVLPVTTLAIVQASVLARYVRSAVLDVIHEDWFRTARAMGWSMAAALWRHGKRNIAVNLLTVIGLQLATLLVGAILIEQVFTIPGLGQRLLLAVGQRDLVMVQGIVLLLVWAVLIINFLIDLTYRAIDPRLKRSQV